MSNYVHVLDNPADLTVTSSSGRENHKNIIAKKGWLLTGDPRIITINSFDRGLHSGVVGSTCSRNVLSSDPSPGFFRLG